MSEGIDSFMFNHNEKSNELYIGLHDLRINDGFASTSQNGTSSSYTLGRGFVPSETFPNFTLHGGFGHVFVSSESIPQFGFPPFHTQPQFGVPLEDVNQVASDYSELFTTDTVFCTRDEAIKWLKEMGFQNNMCIKISRDRKSDARHLGKTMLLCEREGIYTPSKGGENRIRKNTHTKKCGCPFKLMCREHPRGSWKIDVVHGTHNHEIGSSLYGHALAGRLTDEQKRLVHLMTKTHCTPTQIATTLNEFSGNCTRKKQVYNERYNVRRAGMEGRTVVQQFFLKCNDYDYFMEHRADGKTNKITDVFCHPGFHITPQGISYVLLLESTYSTNRYEMPFLEIVGFTSTWKNYNVAGAFLDHEREENYLWAIKQFAKLCGRVQKQPTCIVMDRELALMNAVDEIFPKAKYILCMRHVYKNIEAKAKKIINHADTATRFANAYMELFKKNTIEEYEQSLCKIEVEWSTRKSLLQYVRIQWLEPYRERIVSAWTDTVLTLGTTTTNRVEGEHSCLKNFLTTPHGRLDTVLGQYDSLMRIQVIEIKATFNISHQKTMCMVTIVDVFKQLKYKISDEAMKRLINEYKRGEDPFFEPTCKCRMSVKDGLPCVHKIARWVEIQIHIPLKDVHSFWRQLDLKVVQNEEDERWKHKVARSLMDDFYSNDFHTLSVDQQIRCANAVLELAHPERTSLQEPTVVKTKV